MSDTTAAAGSGSGGTSTSVQSHQKQTPLQMQQQAQPAFRSFWTAQTAPHSNVVDPYGFDPNYKAPPRSGTGAAGGAGAGADAGASSKNGSGDDDATAAAAAAAAAAATAAAASSASEADEHQPLLAASSSSSKSNDDGNGKNYSSLSDASDAAAAAAAGLSTTSTVVEVHEHHHHHHIHEHRHRRSALLLCFDEWYQCWLCLLLALLASLLLLWLLWAKDQPSIAPVCNPFALAPTSVDLEHNHGLVAHFYLLPPNSPARQTAETTNTYVEQAQPMDQTFFFSSLNTPTRAYIDVFEDRDGKQLPSEFFLVQARSTLRVSNETEEGLYEFALICDDGCILMYEDSQTLSEQEQEMQRSHVRAPYAHILVDDDGVHTSKLAVSPVVLPMRVDDELPIMLRYFQGPPRHIALMLLWRKLSDDVALPVEQVVRPPTPLNGQEGNEMWFDWRPTDEPKPRPSVPQSAWDALRADGWSVVPDSVFWLPDEYNEKIAIEQKLKAGIDPCA